MSEQPTPGAALAAALAKAQAAFTNPPRNRTVTVRTKNGAEYSFKYADLAGVLDVVRKPLADNGLAIMQPLAQSDGRVFVRTILLHESGEQLASELEAGSVAMDIKDLGGKITYIRRYALSAMLGIASEEDEDENPHAGAIRDERRDRPQQAPPQQRQAPQKPAAPWATDKAYTVPYTTDRQVYVKLGPDGRPLLADVSTLQNDTLVSLESAIPGRRKWFFDRGLAAMVECCDRDYRLVTGELLQRATAQPTAHEEKRGPAGPKPETKPGALFDAGASADPTDQPTDESQPETTPGRQADLIVATYAVNLAAPCEAEITRVTKQLEPDELTALAALSAGEVLAMALHPANADLFSPAMGKAFVAHNKIEAELFSGVWFQHAWLGAHEDNKSTRLNARKLARTALHTLPLAKRLAGDDTPPQLRPVDQAERAKLLELVTSLLPINEAIKAMAWVAALQETDRE